MKFAKTLVKIAAAVAAIAGIAYLVVTYLDTIKAWLQKLCPCCNAAPEAEEVCTEEAAAEEAPVEEAAAEEAPAEEAPAEDAPVEEAAAEDAEPVADEADFEA